MTESTNQTMEAVSQKDEGAKAQYLTFMLDGETYAIRILAVKEIVGYGKLTAVPMMPRCVRGVINLRGAVLPVVDLLLRFGKRQSDIVRRTCIIVVEAEIDGEKQDVGLVVEAVNAVLDIPDADIAPPPPLGTRVSTEFIQGMGKVNGQFVILLNVNNVLALRGLAELRTAEAA